MSEAQKDTQRALAAATAIFDGRDPTANMSDIMVTLEHTVGTVLLAVMGHDRRKAVAMLNEGLVPGVEQRFVDTQ